MFNEGTLAKNIFVEDGRLNMLLMIEHFIKTYTTISKTGRNFISSSLPVYFFVST